MTASNDLPEEVGLPEPIPPAPSATITGAPVAPATIPPTLVEDAPASAPPSRPGLALLVLLSAVFVQILDVSIVNTAIPSIQRDLSASFAEIQLVLVAYQLGFACTLITGARLGDRFGRRRLFLTGMLGFTLASALCGAAPSATLLILARILQGVCSGLMFPQVLTVIQSTFASSERSRALRGYGATIGLATILGPVAGGGLIALDVLGLDWRSVFLVNIPIGAAALLAGLALLPESRSPRPPRLDLRGITLLVLGLAAVLYPLIAGRELSWPAWSIALLVLGLLTLAGFTLLQLHESRTGGEPLVPASLMRVGSFRRGLALQVAFYAALPAFFLTTTLALQAGLGLTALEAGLITLAVAMGSVITALTSARLAERLGVLALSLGAVLAMIATLGLALQMRGDTLSSPLALIPLMLLLGASLGLVIAPAIQIILHEVTEADHGSASGVLSTAGQVGGAAGIALVGVVFFHLLATSTPVAAAATHDRVRAQLQAASVPEDLHPSLIAQLDRCIRERVASRERTTPEACEPPPPGGLLLSGAVPAGGAADLLGATGALPGSYPEVGGILTNAAAEAQERSYIRAWRGALLVETLLLLAALILTLRLRAATREREPSRS